MANKPMYQNIVDQLKEKIFNGEFTLDKPLPTQIEMAKLFNTSEITSRRALLELVNEGLVYRVRGKGTFISKEENFKDTVFVPVKRIYFVHPSTPLDVFNHRFFMELLKGINSMCEEKNLQFIMWNYDENGDLPDEKDSGFIILTHVPQSKEIPLKSLEKWKNENKKIITVHFYYRHLNIPYVIIDNMTGGYLATQHLLSLGHKKIGIILTGKSLIDINQEFSLRMEGYKLALNQHQINFKPSYVYVAQGNQEVKEMGYEGMNKLLQLNDPPTAIFATSDYKAIGAMQAIKDHGLRIPEDISLIGYDNIPIVEYTNPSLTTVNQNSEKMGKRAVELLMDKRINRSDDLIKDEIVPNLVIRHSILEHTHKNNK